MRFRVGARNTNVLGALGTRMMPASFSFLDRRRNACHPDGRFSKMLWRSPEDEERIRETP